MDGIKIGNLIGKGGFGNVYDGMINENKEIAVKIIPIDNKGIPNILETSIMSTIKHPHINYAYQIYSDNEKLYIIQDKGYCDLYHYIKKKQIPSKLIIKWLFQISHAIACLNSQNIIHSDIKPHNILIFDTGDVKITDFTVSVKKWENDKKFDHTSGTINYLPPEALLSFNEWDEKLDVWSLGCVLYEMVYGELLFPVQVRDENYFEKILNTHSDWEYFISKKRSFFKKNMDFALLTCQQWAAQAKRQYH